MGDRILQRTSADVWDLVARQHGVISREQLLRLGYTPSAIRHRARAGRLHRVRRGVFAVGRPHLTSEGIWMAAVLACGPGARLSHTSGGELWEMVSFNERSRLHVSVPAEANRHVSGVVVHRRAWLDAENVTRVRGIPVTDAVTTLIDLATILTLRQLETAINEAAKRDLVSAEHLRPAIENGPRRQGVAALRAVLDRHTFTLTDSDLEKFFLPIARSAGLALPLTKHWVNGFEVDFFWPGLGLVVETDGLRYHRTPAEQGRDRLRDQTHTAAGLTPVRFTHAQVAYEPRYVAKTLAAVAKRLAEAVMP